MIKLSTYLRQYKWVFALESEFQADELMGLLRVGDIVDIKANGAVQKGSVFSFAFNKPRQFL